MSVWTQIWRRLRGQPRQRKHAAMPSVRYASSPLLASRTPPWRVKFMIGAIGLGFAVLIGRAAWIQIIENDFYLEQGASRYERRIALEANRGRILDRNGELLASSVPAPSLWAIPKDFQATPEQRKELARLLGMTRADLDKRLSGSPNFVWLRRKVDDEVAQAVAALKIKGVHQLREAKRHYPEGEAAAHVVGFTNIEDQGQEGIELAKHDELSGRDGMRRVIKDRLGRVVESVGDMVPAVDGETVRLSIDAKVQFYAYQQIRDAVLEHKAKAGSVVVLDVATGEVLALANVPSYRPDDRRNLTGAQLRNRALTDTFEPGSTMKPFIAAWAIETGRVRPDTIIQTAPGRMNVDGSTITDAHAHDELTVEGVIQKSSNVGTVKLALQMQPREMWELFSAVGLGQKPQIDFPGAVTGRLRPYKSWRRIEQATMSYGYGLSASLFQIAQAYTVFATDGELVPMTLLAREGVVQTSGVQQVHGRKVLSPAVARSVRNMLQMAAGPGGTAPLAQTVGYSVGGKSGTARKQEGRGYATNKYRSWFVGLAPVSQPRIVVAVMVDEPNNGKFYGGAVAAPVFSQVVQHTLNRMGVLPDMAVAPHIVASERLVPAEVESF